MYNLLIITGLLFIIHFADANYCEHEIDGALVNNPAKCDSYFICIMGEGFPAKCPDGRYFNPVTKSCDLADSVECDDSTVCTGIENGALIDNTDLCEGFFYCFDEIPYAAYCPAPLYFNPSTSQCDAMDNVECSFSTEPPTIEPPSLNILCNNISDNTFIKNPDSCKSFYLCLQGVALFGECPEPLHFNPNSRQCDLSENVICDEVVLCKGKTDLSTINNPIGCADFFLCFNEIAIPLKCPSPLMYNAFDNVCDDSMVGRCNPLCDGASEQELNRNPYDCHEWYICMSGEVYASGVCPNNFHFSMVTKRCDHPDNVECEAINTTTAITTSTTEITTTEITTTTPDDNGVSKQLPSFILILFTTIYYFL